jgi:hypothetical protein
VLRESTSNAHDRSLTAPARPARTGANAIERQAVAVVRHEIAAMPASLVVQLALWPDEIATWARAEHTSESLVYNMLARRKPYARARERLAERLAVPVAVLSHLIDARRPLPTAKLGPDDPRTPWPDAPPIDWAARPLPLHRDGTNPVERRAVRSVESDIAAMPASAVVGLALWPETLAEWSRDQRLKSSVVWACLAGSPSERVRSALARRLGTPPSELDALIAAARVEPRARRPIVVADVPPTADDAGHPPDSPPIAPPRADPTPLGEPPERRSSFGEQISLDL